MMQKRSSNSAGAVYLDRESRVRDLEQMARRAAARVPQIRRIILFGSMVNGTPTPRSDADLLVEVGSATDPADVLRAMSPLVCPVDLFVFTCEELAASDPPLVAKTALRDGKDLLR